MGNACCCNPLKTREPVHVAESTQDRLELMIHSIHHVPKKDTRHRADVYVTIQSKGVNRRTQKYSMKTEDTHISIMEAHPIVLDPNEELELIVWDHDMLVDQCIGRVLVKAADVVDVPALKLMLEDKNADNVHDEAGHPTMLHVSVAESGPKSYFAEPATSNFPRHVMIITRGTRGDIQPFVALARGFAEKCGYLVTICTEMRYKSAVLSQCKVTKGAIWFRCSGGDTTTRIETPAAKWALNSKSEVMQMVMLSRGEVEFMKSEPAIYYWAQTLRPDCIVFGFTMASIALTVGQSLNIPIIGFILQPTCIPSTHYPPVIPINTHSFTLFDSIEESFTTHNMQAKIKQLMDNGVTGDGQELSKIRKRRGLPILKRTVWEMFIELETPLIVPISEEMFGGRPDDWPSSFVFTECIFLRSSYVPDLDPSMQDFINRAKADKEPVVLMCFSSMPIPRKAILSLAFKMVGQCACKPRLITLMGPKASEQCPLKVARKADDLKASRKLFEASGAPFGKLLPLMDCIIMHGGLGTTAESLVAGVPCMVTGILLMDQRFWGKRVHALGVGPNVVHISQFSQVCVKNLDECLAPNSLYAARARELGPMWCTSDGVAENVQAFLHVMAQDYRIQNEVGTEHAPFLTRD
uniref:C2 domain-containing protein n=1 Tax=Eutreptiella gymnastica TaxID=73025 RepID=A0A7S1ISJ4_9EUGL|mmetsp:Transcript_38401/g.68672  ORF Transcript_38401/g.68672 Transcript_38401/m.68672 type:complete len:638 (+) Transcript_38401:119-2032(+)